VLSAPKLHVQKLLEWPFTLNVSNQKMATLHNLTFFKKSKSYFNWPWPVTAEFIPPISRNTFRNCRPNSCKRHFQWSVRNQIQVFYLDICTTLLCSFGKYIFHFKSCNLQLSAILWRTLVQVSDNLYLAATITSSFAGLQLIVAAFSVLCASAGLLYLQALRC